MTIALGTLSEAKQRFLEEVLHEIDVQGTVLPIAVASNVSEQPLSLEETHQGALNRATHALDQEETADCGLGIEVGYHFTDGYYEIFCSAAIVDTKGTIISCDSSRMKLPRYHQQFLRENKSLGTYVRDYKKDVDEPVTNYLREYVRGRKPIIIEAVRNVLLQYVLKEDY